MLRAVVLTQYRRVTDGQTDGQTDRIAVANTALASIARAVKMSTSQSAVMLCGWGVKAGWPIPLVDKRVGDR